ncbi:MAG TPA: MlaD family protein [Mariprofundaceae bacterium]|nr:MlaD family protein [Mariprofundaceae bacterium]
MNAQARLGAFVLVALILLGLITSRIGGFVWFKQQHNIVEAEFNDLMGLDPQSDVRMAGVKVGTIQEIRLEGGRALVRIALLPGIRLPASTKASIVSRGMVGEKYLALHATPGDTQWLPDGARIPSEPGGDINTLITQMGSVIGDIRTISDALKQMLANGEGQDSLRALIRKTNETIGEIAQMVHENRQDLHDTIHNLSRVSADLSKDLPASIHQLNEAAKQLPAAIQSGQKFFTAGKTTVDHADAILVDNRENLYRLLFELRKSSENLEALSDDLRRNPWKLINKQPEVPPSPRAKQEQMEEMLLTTGQMGVTPAH